MVLFLPEKVSPFFDKINFGGEKMKKVLVLLTVAVAFGLLPSISQANCVANGTIPRLIVTSPSTQISVRLNFPGATTFLFVTADDTFIQAAAAAEASHVNVTVIGNAAACGAVVGGASAGGTVTQITVSP